MFVPDTQYAFNVRKEKIEREKSERLRRTKEDLLDKKGWLAKAFHFISGSDDLVDENWERITKENWKRTTKEYELNLSKLQKKQGYIPEFVKGLINMDRLYSGNYSEYLKTLEEISDYELRGLFPENIENEIYGRYLVVRLANQTNFQFLEGESSFDLDEKLKEKGILESGDKVVI